MRKVIGWILIVFGGFIFISCVICIPAIFITGSIPFMERIFSVILLIFLTIICGMICCLGIKIKKRKVNVHLNSPTSKVSKNTELMTSQLPALYLQKNNTMYRDEYMMRLENIGFQKADAEKIFDFECEVIRKFDKQYLLSPKFTKMWFFNLKQPFFQRYPKTKEDILKEQYLTVSE
ncbi:MAG: hypothetical protein PUF50_05000, partial [Erysipelotrichaceae bacterium]|nr:hypothetical protein [Erysipelotrichaceae bacterium]